MIHLPLVGLFISFLGLTGVKAEGVEAKFNGNFQGTVKIDDLDIEISISKADMNSNYKLKLFKTYCELENSADTIVANEFLIEKSLLNEENTTLLNLDENVKPSEIKSMTFEKCDYLVGIGETSELSCEEVACENTRCFDCTDWVMIIIIIAVVILILVLMAAIFIVCCLKRRNSKQLLVGDVSPSTSSKTDPHEESCRKSPNMYDSSLSIPFIDASLPPTPKIGRTVNGLDILLGNDTNSLNSSDVQ